MNEVDIANIIHRIASSMNIRHYHYSEYHPVNFKLPVKTILILRVDGVKVSHYTISITEVSPLIYVKNKEDLDLFAYSPIDETIYYAHKNLYYEDIKDLEEQNQKIREAIEKAVQLGKEMIENDNHVYINLKRMYGYNYVKPIMKII